MTKDEFISYTKGVIASEMERARIESFKDFGEPAKDIQLVGALKLIKDALDNMQPDFIPTPGFSISEPNMVPYSEICSCNPKNGGSGICGCIMGNKLVPKNSWGKITTTSTQ